MSWIQKLYEIYDSCQSMVGYSTDESEHNRPLLPVGHITAQAHIEIVINTEGDFQTARVITDKNDSMTIIPCTEGSGSRSGSKPECHPLCDQLQYVAGDYEEFGGTVTSGFSEKMTISKDKIEKVGMGWKDISKKLKEHQLLEKPNKVKLNIDKDKIEKILGEDYQKILSVLEQSEPFMDYIKLLSGWCGSKFSHPKAQAVLKYVQKGVLIKDLIKTQIMFIGKNQKFLLKKEMNRQKNALDIFSLVNSQEDAFIRWIVEDPRQEGETKTWKDKTLWASWRGYYFSTKQKEPLCYVTGDKDFLSSNHPKYIRAKGDGAKLISANDMTDFTFRGRFLAAEQACGVSSEVSQKAHNALLWLISRQGKVFRVKGSSGKFEPALTVVAWSTSGKPIPKLTDDSLATLGFDTLPNDQPVVVSTAQDTAIKFRNRMLGYASQLGKRDNVVVMVLDSASKGRIAIMYYRENLTGSEFFQKVENWHKTCEWIHEYRYKDIEDKQTGKKKRFFQPFIGAPAPIDIAKAVYGESVDDKLRNSTVARILPCIIDGQKIPRDLVESAVRRASNRAGMEKWEWNKTLSIACALYRKYHTKEGYNMSLDSNRKKRDYLYGRLLAIADCLEGHALYKANEKRDTTAARYMQRFAERPYSTWRQIYLSLAPYMARLGGAKYYKDLMDEVKCKFDPIEDFTNDRPLSGEFLLSFHCQRADLWKKGKDEESSEQEGD